MMDRIGSISASGDVRDTWKEYFEDLYDVYREERVKVHMCVFFRYWKR